MNNNIESYFFFKKELEIFVSFWIICYEQPKKIFYNLVGYLKLDLIWYIGWFKTKKKKCTDNGFILNEIEKNKLCMLKEQVLSNTFNWTRVDKIQKKEQEEILFLNLLVQEVLKILMEPIFEINFEFNSFGFRPYKNCHTALSYMSTKMKSSIWLLRGNLKHVFDNISQQKLLIFIGLRIKDNLILNLLYTGFKFNVFNFFYIVQPDLVMPYGKGLTPLLVNIYLDLLDKKINSLHMSNSSFSLKYLRYGSVFLLGIQGSYELTVLIKKKIINYLRIYLAMLLQPDSLQIFHISKGITFLGYFWKRRIILIKSRFNNFKQKQIIFLLNVDIKNVLKVLKYLNVCEGSGKSLPLLNFIHLSQFESNTYVNLILSSLSDWWSLAFNRKYALSFITSIFRSSLSKMYAAKFKLKTTASVKKKGSFFLNKELGNEKKLTLTPFLKTSSLIPKILYTEYNYIPKKINYFNGFLWQQQFFYCTFIKLRTFLDIMNFFKVEPINESLTSFFQY